ncbi:set domain-containing protein 5 [Colletotrichum truncatum]|uniref:Set domain-containing protein 5 n=1 Tax=Colletotrichum truncatum TaxID=5467 RepID=A0ACC3ZGJ4_COLTU|nr:set domain-containing protein 5 [Colletotrichum truncatum]KAF6784736.1 set domain-containing protein 5 [Colletotrichum truncatum]
MDSWDDQLAHFKSIPWCAELLSEPDLLIRPLISRTGSRKTRAFEFIGVTLNSEATVPFLLAFLHPPTSQAEAAEKNHDLPLEERNKLPLEERFATKLYCLVTLGHGLTSFREGLCHGGAVASLFDECNGALGIVNKMFGLMEPKMHVTQSMNVTYLRPVPTQTTVLITSTLTRVEGTRRFVVQGEMADENGTVLVKSEVVYVILDKPMDAMRSVIKEKL